MITEKFRKLTEVVEFVGGSQPPKSAFSYELKTGYVRLIQIRDYKSENHLVYVPKKSTKKFCDENDVMIGRYGPPVFQILRGLSGAYNVALMKAKPKIKELENDYLFWFLQNPSIQNYIIGISQRSAGQSGVNKKALEQYEIYLPPLPEQKRIVAKLDALFERIDKAIALVEENITATKALMDSVLGEVFVKRETLLSSACDIRPKKSEVREIPGSTLVSFLPMKDLNENQISFKATVEKELGQVYKGYTYFKDGDVLLAKVTPCFENGKAGVARKLKNGIGFGSSEFHVLRPKEGVLPEWIYYSISTKQFREEGVNHFTGSSGLKRVPANFVEDYKIFLPNTEERQREILHYIEKSFNSCNTLIEQQSKKLQSLHDLKSSLLDQAFKGEL